MTIADYVKNEVAAVLAQYGTEGTLFTGTTTYNPATGKSLTGVEMESVNVVIGPSGRGLSFTEDSFDYSSGDTEVFIQSDAKVAIGMKMTFNSTGYTIKAVHDILLSGEVIGYHCTIAPIGGS